MQTVGAFEAKAPFSALLDKVEKGKQIVITKHGRVVAKLVPATVANHLRIESYFGIKRFEPWILKSD